MRQNTNVLYRGSVVRFACLGLGVWLLSSNDGRQCCDADDCKSGSVSFRGRSGTYSECFTISAQDHRVSFLRTVPSRRDALLFANIGFLLYANAFLQNEAALAEWSDYELAAELNERARRMYLRARDYGLRLVEIEHPGITDRLFEDPEAAVMVFRCGGCRDACTILVVPGCSGSI